MLNISDIIGQSLVDTTLTLITLLPHVLVAIVLFVLGLAAGSVLGKAVAHVINLLRVDKALNKAGVEELSAKTGVHISVAAFFGGLVKWTLSVASAVAAAEMLGLRQITQLLYDILVYIPNVIVAAVALIIATLLGDFVARVVYHSAKGMGTRGHFAAQVAKWSIIIVGGIFPALTQLRVAQGLVEVLFTGVVFAFSLALGLAFGLGGRDAAARAIEKIKED